ncbi:MAG: hypothetical protein ACREHG_08600, partial [Candidatus Saccharimonadales bacterium]
LKRPLLYQLSYGPAPVTRQPYGFSHRAVQKVRFLLRLLFSLVPNATLLGLQNWVKLFLELAGDAKNNS